MAWTSFNTTLDEIATVLSNDSAINNYCTQTWGKSLSVLRRYQKKSELHISELPVCMITRPTMKPASATAGLIYRTHIVRLYIGFEEADREKAQEELIRLEELVEEALLKEDSLSPNVLVQSAESSNDEGVHHPVYYLVKNMEVMTEREV